MGDCVWFATAEKMDTQRTESYWAGMTAQQKRVFYNNDIREYAKLLNSGFNGFPFATRLANEWDGSTFYAGQPSGSSTRIIDVFGAGTYWPCGMSIEQMVELFWRAQTLQCSRTLKTEEITYHGNADHVFGELDLPVVTWEVPLYKNKQFLGMNGDPLYGDAVTGELRQKFDFPSELLSGPFDPNNPTPAPTYNIVFPTDLQDIADATEWPGTDPGTDNGFTMDMSYDRSSTDSQPGNSIDEFLVDVGSPDGPAQDALGVYCYGETLRLFGRGALYCKATDLYYPSIELSQLFVCWGKSSHPPL